MQDLNPLLDGMTEGAERTRDIVDGLKRFSAIDGRAEQAFNLAAVVGRAVRWVARSGLRDFTVKTDLPSELPVIGSSGQMQQVLINIVQNACDATAGCDAPTLEISAEQRDGMILLHFADNGPLTQRVEVLAADVAERQRRFAQRAAVAVRALGDLGGAVVADVRGQRGDQHQRALEQFGDALAPRLDAAHAVRLEAAHAVGQQAHALQEVVGDQRLEDVEFEVAGRAADADRRRRCPSPGSRAWSAPRTGSG
jgi:hypothetical protein